MVGYILTKTFPTTTNIFPQPSSSHWTLSASHTCSTHYLRWCPQAGDSLLHWLFVPGASHPTFCSSAVLCPCLLPMSTEREPLLSPGSWGHTKGLCYTEKASNPGVAWTDRTVWCWGTRGTASGLAHSPQDCEHFGAGAMSYSPLFPCAWHVQRCSRNRRSNYCHPAFQWRASEGWVGPLEMVRIWMTDSNPEHPA
jgi:hypothetical protein